MHTCIGDNTKTHRGWSSQRVCIEVSYIVHIVYMYMYIYIIHVHLHVHVCATMSVGCNCVKYMHIHVFVHGTCTRILFNLTLYKARQRPRASDFEKKN